MLKFPLRCVPFRESTCYATWRKIALALVKTCSASFPNFFLVIDTAMVKLHVNIIFNCLRCVLLIASSFWWTRRLASEGCSFSLERIGINRWVIILLRRMRLCENLRFFVKNLTVFTTFRHVLEVCNMVLYLGLCINNIRRLWSFWKLIILSLVVHSCLVFVFWNDNVLVMRLVCRTRGRTLMLHNNIVLLFFRYNSALNNLAWIFLYWLLKSMWRQSGFLSTSTLALRRCKLHLYWSFIQRVMSLWRTVSWMVLLMVHDLRMSMMWNWILVAEGKLRFVLVNVAVAMSSAIPVQFSVIRWANIAHRYIIVTRHSIPNRWNILLLCVSITVSIFIFVENLMLVFTIFFIYHPQPFVKRVLAMSFYCFINLSFARICWFQAFWSHVFKIWTLLFWFFTPPCGVDFWVDWTWTCSVTLCHVRVINLEPSLRSITWHWLFRSISTPRWWSFSHNNKLLWIRMLQWRRFIRPS